MARILEAGLARRLVQVGIRAMSGQRRERAARLGVEVIEMRDLPADLTTALDGPCYISFDLDGLDSAFAPGVSHPEPGGLSTRQAISLIQGLDGRLVGADIVELNPGRDVGGITAAVGAKLVKEITARLLEG
jgi:arginase